MTTIKLNQLLTDDQIEAVMDIINTYPDSIERVRKLKAYFEPMKGDLEKKGVVADYLAYVIEHLVSTRKPDSSLVQLSNRQIPNWMN